MTDKPKLEVVDLSEDTADDERVEIPLHMIQGNMQVLRKLAAEGEMLPCDGIALRDYDRGVVMVISGSEQDKAFWDKVGFQTRNVAK